MRVTPLVLAVLAACGAAVVTGCSPQVDRQAGNAAPAAQASPTTSAGAAAPPQAPPESPRASGPKPASGGIRDTDWRNVTIAEIPFQIMGNVTFRNGETRTDGRTCYILPSGAKPAYGHFIAEEPASRPSTEDALVLVECGGDSTLQALIPVQADGAKRRAVGAIEADRVSGSGPQMTFTSYQVDNQGTVNATVKRPDGRTEARRYRWGGNGWDRL